MRRNLQKIKLRELSFSRKRTRKVKQSLVQCVHQSNTIKQHRVSKVVQAAISQIEMLPRNVGQ